MKRLVSLFLVLAGAAAHADDDDRLGRFRLQARLGPAVSVAAQSSTLASAGRPALDASLVLSLAVSPGRRARLLFAPGFVYTAESYVPDPSQPIMMGDREVFIVSIPLGFEYDIPIKRVPGLYLYPQLLLGYAANTVVLSGGVAFAGGATSATLHQGLVEVTIGARYAFRNRLEVMVEPFSMPVYFSRGSALALYGARAGVGVRFP